MRFLRRHADDDVATADPADDGPADAPESTDPEVAGRRHTPGKGRPTPKRREAEGRRRGPAPPPPKTQREAQKLAKKNRARRRQNSSDRRARMLAGDESALMARDRGPVKAFARDVVDSRWHLMGLFMPLAAVVLLSLVLPIPQIQSLISLFTMIVLASIFLEAVLLGRKITKMARERFPKETISGLSLGWYAFGRASQLRRLRTPKPRVKRGASV
ncbi:MAG TPA: DUF3043 domain-containing protein [Pseudonocardia sp.]